MRMDEDLATMSSTELLDEEYEPPLAWAWASGHDVLGERPNRGGRFPGGGRQIVPLRRKRRTLVPAMGVLPGGD